MAAPHIAPYGSWRSPITAGTVAGTSVGFPQVALDGEHCYWLEARPSEAGRNVLVRRAPDGTTEDVTPAPFNVRTRVHEYGGGAFTIADGVVYFSNFADNRLYRQGPGEQPEPLTSESAMRYADLHLDAARNRLLCVREDHSADGLAVNTLVAVDLAGGADTVLASGYDFYSAPRLSPDGSQLVCLTWNLPHMPWDGTELWLAKVAPDGTLANAAVVAGSPSESIAQPKWSPDGTLFFLSDRTDWWNLYRWRAAKAEPIAPLDAEFGHPQWMFALDSYGFRSAAELICVVSKNGLDRLGRLDTATGELGWIDLPYTRIGVPVVRGDTALFVGFTSSAPNAVVQLNLGSGKHTVLKRSNDVVPDPRYLSTPEAIEFPTEGGLTAHAFFYAPHNADYAAPAGERPPLLVLSHGGPTGATAAIYSPQIQFWTSRGIAVVDVNYGGSAGYGRAYRERLYGNWGVVDVDDCANAARFLARRGSVDKQRLIIRGGSAGGYTTLCALTFRDDFKAGASYYGIGDLETFVQDTHKFESGYLEQLIGPYPERKDLYYERSPINWTNRLECPVILFQGLDDKVVPPNQAELMVEALQAKGLPVAYVALEGEGHGFRNAKNMSRVLEAELYFYARVFGFELADPVEPVPIDNLEAA